MKLTVIRRLSSVPTCARCNRPCEKVVEHYDAFMQRVEFYAYCHGESERVTLTDAELIEMRAGDFSFGLAFVGPRMLEAGKGHDNDNG